MILCVERGHKNEIEIEIENGLRVDNMFFFYFYFFPFISTFFYLF